MNHEKPQMFCMKPLYAALCESEGQLHSIEGPLVKFNPDYTLPKGEILSTTTILKEPIEIHAFGASRVKMAFDVTASSKQKIEQQLLPYNERLAKFLTGKKLSSEEIMVQYRNADGHDAADHAHSFTTSDHGQYTETLGNGAMGTNNVKPNKPDAKNRAYVNRKRHFKKDEALRINEECGIREVWQHNLEHEFGMLRKVVQLYQYVAMDTEFPGVVARPVGEFCSTGDYHYQLLRCNVDMLSIIQLGLTFMDESGNTPPGISTWQFNFKFDLDEDMFAQDSIDMLRRAGIQFERHFQDGIIAFNFAELLMSSGIVLMDNIKWLTFHSGYDFGYLLKLLTAANLPAKEPDFFEMLEMYFPNVYDIKCLMKTMKQLKGGLQEVADQLKIVRIGPQHQAGSDALLTGMTFFKMRAYCLQNNIDFDKYRGQLYGLNNVNKKNDSNANANA